MPESLLLFDFDGVLVDSFDHFYSSFVDACHAHGQTQIDGSESFLHLFDLNVYEGMEAAGVPRDRIAPILETMGRNQRSSSSSYSFFPRMREVVATLSARYPLYIITSSTTAEVSRFLARHELDAVRDVIGSDRETSKVRKIRFVLADHPGAEAWYMGDTAGDMREAREAGVRPVAVGWGWHNPERLMAVGPDRLVERPEDLLAIFPA